MAAEALKANLHRLLSGEHRVLPVQVVPGSHSSDEEEPSVIVLDNLPPLPHLEPQDQAWLVQIINNEANHEFVGKDVKVLKSIDPKIWPDSESVEIFAREAIQVVVMREVEDEEGRKTWQLLAATDWLCKRGSKAFKETVPRGHIHFRFFDHHHNQIGLELRKWEGEPPPLGEPDDVAAVLGAGPWHDRISSCPSVTVHNGFGSIFF